MPAPETQDPLPPGKVGTWMFLAAEMMFFIALVGSYIVLRSSSRPMFESQSSLLNKPMGAANVLVLIGSSLTMAMGVSAARTGRHRRVMGMLGLTALLGCVFLAIGAFQPIGDMRHSRFWASYALLSGAHRVHLAGGLVALGVLGVQTARGGILAAATEYVGMYWHFVVGVWIVLFGLLYLT
ncbi:MAG: heme-copper oxidase subunit III [Phycisphaerales bacterium]|jgi:heme/copper-type cytochrome/quinol oxidase subunit 3|nr:heme-copper oxidase subunit III [Phycisphaerales bacterium]